MTCHMDDSLRIEAQALRDLVRKHEAEIERLERSVFELGADRCIRIVAALMERRGMGMPPPGYPLDHLLHRLVMSGQITLEELEAIA